MQRRPVQAGSAFLQLAPIKQFGFEVSIKLNNRKILAGIAETIGMSDKLTSLTIAIDKLDKVGIAGVEAELLRSGIETEALESLKKVFQTTGINSEKIDFLADYLNFKMRI